MKQANPKYSSRNPKLLLVAHLVEQGLGSLWSQLTYRLVVLKTNRTTQRRQCPRIRLLQQISLSLSLSLSL